MRSLLRRLGLRSLAGLVATCLFSVVMFSHAPASGDTITGPCMYEGGSPTTPTVNNPSYVECGPNRQMVVSGPNGSPLPVTGTITTLPAITFASPQAVTQSGTFNVNQTTGASGYSFLLDSAGTNKASINVPGAQLTALGKTRFILTSGSATACTNLQATAGTLVSVINAGSATAVFPAWYDDAGATCATGARLYGNFTSLTLQAGQVVNLSVPLNAGLAYKLSGALSDNLVVVTQ